MKNISLIALILASSYSYANTDTQQSYDLTVSSDGSSYVFSKTSSPYGSYALHTANDENGTEYKFVPNPTKPDPDPDPTPVDPAISWKDTQQHVQNLDEAKKVCSQLKYSNREWKLPTIADIQNAIDNKDMGAVAAFHPDSNPMLNMYHVDSIDATAAAFITGFPASPKVVLRTGVLGNAYSPLVICVSDNS
ncbi:TPA: hypothetical protein ACX6RT_000851 [Photobacterium damselae]